MRVVLKDYKELRELCRAGKIELMHHSNDGEILVWATKDGACFQISSDDMGEEFLIIDHERPLGLRSFERLGVFFKPSADMSGTVTITKENIFDAFKKATEGGDLSRMSFADSFFRELGFPDA